MNSRETWHPLDRYGSMSMLEKSMKSYGKWLMAKSKILRIFKEVIVLNRPPFIDSLSLADI
jgi:hypothetical protein